MRKDSDIFWERFGFEFKMEVFRRGFSMEKNGCSRWIVPVLSGRRTQESLTTFVFASRMYCALSVELYCSFWWTDTVWNSKAPVFIPRTSPAICSKKPQIKIETSNSKHIHSDCTIQCAPSPLAWSYSDCARHTLPCHSLRVKFLPEGLNFPTIVSGDQCKLAWISMVFLSLCVIEKGNLDYLSSPCFSISGFRM